MKYEIEKLLKIMDFIKYTIKNNFEKSEYLKNGAQ